MEERQRADDRVAGLVPQAPFGGCGAGVRPEPEQGGRLATDRRAVDRGKGDSARAAPTRRTRKAAASRPSKTTAEGGMSEAQSAYLRELADEEGGDFDPNLTKEEGARRIGELLIKQMARRSPTEPPF